MAAEAFAVSTTMRSHTVRTELPPVTPMHEQFEFDGVQEAMKQMLHAHRMFKREIDAQLQKFQTVTRPLELKLQGLHRETHRCRATTADPSTNRATTVDLSTSDVAEDEDRLPESTHQCVSTKGNLYSEPLATPDLQVYRDPLFKSRKLDLQQEVTEEYAAFERVDLEEEARALEEEGRVRSEPGWKRRLKSNKFDLFVGLVIVVNILMILLRIEYEGVLHQPGTDRSSSSALEAFIEIAEHVLTGFFVLELMLRLLAHGFDYLRVFSNTVDALIVIGSCIESWLFPILWNESSLNLSLLRIFRLLKLMKVLRIVRVIKAFAPLRVLVNAICNSVGALVWSLMLLFVLEIIFAVLMAQLLESVIRDETYDLELRKKVWNSFGTAVRAWLTTFEITMAPGGFMQHAYLFEDVHPMYVLVMIAYVCLVTFATIRVITALFLRTTLSAADKDSEQEVALVKMRRLAYSNHLCKCLEEAEGEHEGKGRIDKNGLNFLMAYKRMSDWLEDAGLSTDDATRLFAALNLGDGTVFLSEFLAIISQITDRVHDRDAILHYESARALHILNNLNDGMLLQRSGHMGVTYV